jgi:hypothetical protein
MTIYTPAPLHRPSPVCLTPWSEESVGVFMASCGLGSNPASGTGTVADMALFIPFEIAVPFVAKEVGWVNGSVTGGGNAQVGTYREDGTLIVECTATTTSGTNARQTIELTDTTHTPGRYYMAFRASNASDRFFRATPSVSLMEAAGLMQQASQTDLPATATFAVLTTAWLPLIYIAGHTLL